MSLASTSCHSFTYFENIFYLVETGKITNEKNIDKNTLMQQNGDGETTLHM
jgi:hypothetical protein